MLLEVINEPPACGFVAVAALPVHDADVTALTAAFELVANATD